MVTLARVRQILAHSLASLSGAASGLATLNGSSKVVQDPANATATPTASKIPIADGAGVLDPAWTKAPFLSAEITGNGGAQSTAHGLGVTPRLVIAIPSQLTAGIAGGFTVTYGAHTSTNAIVTVTNNEKYRVVAFA